MEFSRQEYWNGWPFLSAMDRPDPGIKPTSPALEADSLPSEPPGKPCSINYAEPKEDMSSAGSVLVWVSMKNTLTKRIYFLSKLGVKQILF